MYQCRLCSWEVTLDDVVLRFLSGRCICLRCYLHETETEKAMTADMRRDTQRAIQDAEGQK